ncbi:hypothetical protein O2W15_06140 [Modestobacter sp. VKM Ac-2979]|uniref:hypothetical protein n=1 Tax=unclassified Modestobacter TaxID=2643866 RepID=UPI0022AB9414|nr:MULTISPECIES: hypothetical protein [unclassified Modestobacter]MCZ2811010.1 hypothetical protein [Modestobacter sp. VKM Ac-2979]MCZ2840523.1 hypothetical protein [Modestobacter sp. VKM Ac-2980]
MTRSENFKMIGEVSADERARIAFGKAGVRRDDRYAVATNEEGQILLTPLVSIPKRELLVWENEMVRASLGRALAESAAGDTVDRGDFSQYAQGDEPEEGDA